MLVAKLDSRFRGNTEGQNSAGNESGDDNGNINESYQCSNDVRKNRNLKLSFNRHRKLLIISQTNHL